MNRADRIEQFGAVLHYVSAGVIVTDYEGTISFANPYVEDLLGASSGAMVGTNAADYVHADGFQAVRNQFDHSQAEHQSTMSRVSRLRTGGGDWIWVEATTSLVDDPRIGGFVTTFHDITEQKMAEARREAVAEFGLWALQSTTVAELLQRATELVLEFLKADAVTVFERVEAADEYVIPRVWAGGPQPFVGINVPSSASGRIRTMMRTGDHFVVDDYSQADALEQFWYPVKRIFDNSGIRSSLGVVIASGDAAWGALVAISLKPASFDASDIAFTQALANVLGAALERDHIESLRAEQALHDPLTGLANRALLNDRIKLALEATHRAPDEYVAVLYIDVDNFKPVNDSLGHEVGDELLCEVARRLEEVVRAEDTIARIGGDEFVVVASMHPDSEDPVAIADRIVDSFNQPCRVGTSELFVTVSIGIATSRTDLYDGVTLLRDADVAMYEAKRSGRNCCVAYETRLRAPLLARASLEHDLHAAMASDQFLLFFQPVVDSDFGRKVGCEALLRWVHPQRGLILPDEFIPILEETGMILTVGKWIIDRACQQIAQWQRDFGRPDLTVSVNLSPRQLTDPELAHCIERALSSNRLTPSSLMIELTETMMVNDLEQAQSVVESIVETGVDLVIDDFGTGYLSLSYLKRLPVNCIKIDRSFITNICDDPGDRAIVGAVVELARGLGLSTVAGGVETLEQLAVVRALGCILIQGFYYSRALPAYEFAAKWLSAPALTRVT
jgi:diguanylate cyclase (GGDEF)-like protein/PAS domain S-box-containing protein